jgi:hypothetical protein
VIEAINNIAAISKDFFKFIGYENFKGIINKKDDSNK